MKATLGDKVIASADTEDLVMVEGNWYFPPSAVDWPMLESSPTPHTCPWKGQAQYYSLVGGPKDIAWSYVAPNPDAIARIGRDITKFVAFDPAVVISE